VHYGLEGRDSSLGLYGSSSLIGLRERLLIKGEGLQVLLRPLELGLECVLVLRQQLHVGRRENVLARGCTHPGIVLGAGVRLGVINLKEVGKAMTKVLGLVQNVVFHAVGVGLSQLPQLFQQRGAVVPEERGQRSLIGLSDAGGTERLVVQNIVFTKK
jgi:hypothetical protein